ncbi:hypothetical protein K474DRAFT_1634213 [Panus rudis PR-1116 ss-1]|nr:hypothetical protein K474DRAFT_1634213 [Panus rudis PR-1116 ss-1]
MHLEPENATHLKPWLVRTLEPICDAEPGALAEYILALLKHNAPEADLRRELNTELEEFLENETTPFIDTLFTALRTKSYLPYTEPAPAPAAASTSTQPADGGIPIPLDALLAPAPTNSPERSRKRGYDYDDDTRPVKGPRLSDDSQYGRYGRHDNRSQWGEVRDRGERGSRMGLNGRADFMDGGMNGAMDMGRTNNRGPRPDQRRGICRDYYNNGYCARGAFCKYSHGEDAVVPAQLFPLNGGLPGGQTPFAPMIPSGNMPFGMNGAQNAPYDPHERMDVRPIAGTMGMGPGRPHNPRAPLLPRHGEAGNALARKAGELPHIQDLTPELPPEDRMQQDVRDDVNGMVRQGISQPMAPSGPITMPMSTGDVDMAGPSTPMRGGFRGYRGGPHMGAGRGTFQGDAANFRPDRRNDKTLVVEKIPEDKLSLGAVNDWFKKFGTVTNVAVDTAGGKALVSFATHDEARAAWKSEDAVFGNRFVKVFWHRPMEGHGQLGTRMLAASASLVANFQKEPTPGAISPNETPSSSSVHTVSASAPAPASVAAPHRKPSTSAAAAALAAKQRLLEQQIAEQKILMAKLSTANPEEKKNIMARLRKLNEEMKAPSSTIPLSATPATSQSPVQPSPSPAPANKSRSTTPHLDNKEKQKELLDKELELHSATVHNGQNEPEESTEELQARLAKLKEEAASLGLSDIAATHDSYYGSSYRPYRGRGRGARGYYRGAMRGGPPRANLTLDNRPKKLLVKGVNSEQIQAVKDWYETTGQLESVETIDGGDVLVAFKTRSGAEQGLAKGTSIAMVGPVQISWYTGQPNGTHAPKALTPATKSAMPTSPSTKMNVDDSSAPLNAERQEVRPDNHAPEPGHQDDEVVAGGWGDDAEDGFGML